MHFLGILALVIAVVFVGSLAVSGLGGAVESLTLTLERSEVERSDQTAFSSRLLSQRRTGTTAEAETETLQEPVGPTVTDILDDLVGASHFGEFFDEVNGEQFISDDNLYTLFVPANSAFEKLPTPTLRSVNTMSDEEKERFIKYHMVPQKLVATNLVKAGTATAVSRDMLNFEIKDSGGTVGNANIIMTYPAKDGIVYLIDGVLLPPEVR